MIHCFCAVHNNKYKKRNTRKVQSTSKSNFFAFFSFLNFFPSMKVRDFLYLKVSCVSFSLHNLYDPSTFVSLISTPLIQGWCQSDEGMGSRRCRFFFFCLIHLKNNIGQWKGDFYRLQFALYVSNKLNQMRFQEPLKKERNRSICMFNKGKTCKVNLITF